MSIEESVISPPTPITWESNVERILSAPNADALIGARRAEAAAHGLLAVIFDSNEVAEGVSRMADYEISTGRAKTAKYIVMLNGGKPAHDDLNASIKSKSGTEVKIDRIRVSAYDGTTFVGARVIEGPDYDPQTLEESDEIVLTDDGFDKFASSIVVADHLATKYGITDVSAIAALAKQPEILEVAGIKRFYYNFTMPYGLWGEGNGFDNKGWNGDLRLVAFSKSQPKESFDQLEHTIEVLGGKEGLAIATIDEIIEYNRI